MKICFFISRNKIALMTPSILKYILNLSIVLIFSQCKKNFRIVGAAKRKKNSFLRKNKLHRELGDSEDLEESVLSEPDMTNILDGD